MRDVRRKGDDGVAGVRADAREVVRADAAAGRPPGGSLVRHFTRELDRQQPLSCIYGTRHEGSSHLEDRETHRFQIPRKPNREDDPWVQFWTTPLLDGISWMLRRSIRQKAFTRPSVTRSWLSLRVIQGTYIQTNGAFAKPRGENGTRA